MFMKKLKYHFIYFFISYMYNDTLTTCRKNKLILLGYVFKISQHKIKDVKFNIFYANNNVIIIWLND